MESIRELFVLGKGEKGFNILYMISSEKNGGRGIVEAKDAMI